MPLYEPHSALSKITEEKRTGAEHDELVGEHAIGGPLTGRDARMFLDVSTLERLLELAKASSVGRAQIDGVGIRIRSRRDRHGHVYETWQIVGQAPQPEQHAFFDGVVK